MCIHPHRFCVIIHDCYIDRTQHAVANHHRQNIYRFGSSIKFYLLFKATSFTRLTRLSVQALIPTELQAGIYSVYIATDGNKRSNSVEIEIST